MAYRSFVTKPLAELMMIFDWTTWEQKFGDAWNMVQWNLSVTTTSITKSITCDLFSHVF